MIVKETRLTIDGKHLNTLLDVCEMAARYIREHKSDNGDGTYTVKEFQILEVRDIEALIDTVMGD